jgi:ribonuclease HI
MDTYTIVTKKDSIPDIETCALLQFDGLAVPNPGEATGGAVLFKDNTKKDILFETGEYVKFGTNNIAEYTGLFIGVKEAAKLKIKNIIIEGDSMLVIQQVSGKWKVNNEVLKIYHSEIVKLLKTKFDFVAIKHVYRKDNTHADDLTNETFRIKSSFIRINEDLI